jgi:hypothetical protein
LDVTFEVRGFQWLVAEEGLEPRHADYDKTASTFSV